jgi:hypothetical protein
MYPPSSSPRTLHPSRLPAPTSNIVFYTAKRHSMIYRLSVWKKHPVSSMQRSTMCIHITPAMAIIVWPPEKLSAAQAPIRPACLSYKFSTSIDGCKRFEILILVKSEPLFERQLVDCVMKELMFPLSPFTGRSVKLWAI